MVASISLRVVEGPAAGKSFVASHFPVTVGRDPGTDLCLDDPRVSLLHLQIRREGDAIIATDMGGRFLVNGRRVSESPLQHRDRFVIGGSEILVEFEAASAPAAAPRVAGVAAPSLPIVEPAAPDETAEPGRLRPAEAEAFDTPLYHMGDSSFEPPPPRPEFMVAPPDPRFGTVFTSQPGFRFAQPDRRLYAVVDAARNFRLAEEAKVEGFDPVSLFVGPRAAQLGEVAPYFFTVPDGSPYLDTWIEAVGTSGGVLIDSPADPATLFQHLRTIFVVEDETGQEFFFRYYDPRVLRKYLPTCTNEELAEFFGPVSRWICEVEGKPEFWSFSRTASGKLSQEALGSLARARRTA